MKKILYAVMFMLVGLFMYSPSMAQRGWNNGHDFKNAKHHRESKKSIHKHRKDRYQNYGHYQKHQKYNKHHSNDRYNNGKRYAKRHRVAPWARERHYKYAHHVYFPDYRAFYDARRNGYVYLSRGRWVFTSSIPSFLTGVNWNRARLEYMNNVPLSVHPEEYYRNYRQRYPAVSLNINIGL